MSKLLSNLVTAAMTIGALTVIGLALRRLVREDSELGRLPGAVWNETLAAGSWIGDSLAAIKIVEFADFQCPFCARLAPRLRSLVRSRNGQVAILFRHYPLENIHKDAQRAAVAAECAYQFGRFEAMHDALFAHQDSIGVSEWRFFLQQAGIEDEDRFEMCLNAETPLRRVNADLSLARRLRLPGTPAVIVAGRVLIGRQLDSLELIVGRTLESH